MYYTFKIKETKITSEQIKGLLVYGDPDGMIKDVEISNDIIIAHTWGEIDPESYEFWNNKNGEEVLWIQEITPHSIQKKFSEIIWESEISGMVIAEYLESNTDANDCWLSLEKDCDILKINIFDVCHK